MKTSFQNSIGKFCSAGIFIFFFSVFSSAQNVRLWSGYVGDYLQEKGLSVATDFAGNAIVAGVANSPSGVDSNAFQNTYMGFQDGLIFKTDANGNLKWSTYYGGTTYDVINDVATDANGNIYVTGSTNSQSGIAYNGFQNTYTSTSGNLAFLAKFDSTGNRIWGTYYGVNNSYGISLAVDDADNVYMSGMTTDTAGFSYNGYQNNFGGGTWDCFIVKFDPAGNRTWATYIGGPGDDLAGAVTVDDFGNIFYCGNTTSTTGIAYNGYQNTNYLGAADAFLVKLDQTGLNRIWGTYFGGTGNEYAYAVTTDQFGNVYLGGETQSATNIAYQGSQNIFGGFIDAYAAKFSASGTRIWATYVGGQAAEEGLDMACDKIGNVYFSGDTYSPINISLNGFQNNIAGNENQFLIDYSYSGTRICGTYYGQNHDEDGHCAVDNSGHVFLCGTANGPGLGSNSFDTTYMGGDDAYLVKFNAFTMGVNEIHSENSFSIYPNPASENFSINFSDHQIHSVEIFNAMGELINQFSVSENKTINTSEFSNGIYFVRMDGTLTKKLVIE